tara:strand:+ start:18320 stop:18637 length:318 start_codon:yes stop_codon:yes gene_type:complete
LQILTELATLPPPYERITMADKKKKFEPNEQRGFIFKNKFKSKDSQPDFQGSCKLDGKIWQVTLWKKVTKNGDPMLSLSFTTEEVKSKKYASAPGQPIEEDDLPF